MGHELHLNWIFQRVLQQALFGRCWHTISETNSSPLKIGLNAPKGNNRIPTIFRCELLVSGTVKFSIDEDGNVIPPIIVSTSQISGTMRMWISWYLRWTILSSVPRTRNKKERVWSFGSMNIEKSLPIFGFLSKKSDVHHWKEGYTYMGVSKNRGTPKWMVYNGNPIKMDDLGVPLFLETLLKSHFQYWERDISRLKKHFSGTFAGYRFRIRFAKFCGILFWRPVIHAFLEANNIREPPPKSGLVKYLVAKFFDVFCWLETFGVAPICCRKRTHPKTCQ